MERLISFLSNNIIFVIMIVGIIYTMFFRKSPLERPPNRMPDFGGEGFPRPRRPGETRPAARPVSRPEAEQIPTSRPAAPTAPRRQPEWMETRGPRPRTAQPEQPQRTDDGWAEARHEQPVQRSLSEEPRVTLVEPAQLPEQPRHTDRTAISAQPPGLDDLGGSDSGAVLTQENLSRAVMWAEILGPPRARRPHRR